MKDHHSIRLLCEQLEVSQSGYYLWRQRATNPGPRAREDHALALAVVTIHSTHRHTYGSPRIVRELRTQGHRHGRQRIARLMRQAGLCGRQKGRYRVQTTDSNHHHPIAPNRLAEAPAPTAPNQIWVADITYIETQEGWLYLAGVLDLYPSSTVVFATDLIINWLRNHNSALALHFARGFWRQLSQGLGCRDAGGA